MSRGSSDLSVGQHDARPGPGLSTAVQSGYLVPAGAVDALRDRILRLLRNPELLVRLGNCGRAMYEAQFGLDQALNKTLAVMRTCRSAKSIARTRRARDVRIPLLQGRRSGTGHCATTPAR
jgi:hypothetical protein